MSEYSRKNSLFCLCVSCMLLLMSLTTVGAQSDEEYFITIASPRKTATQILPTVVSDLEWSSDGSYMAISYTGDPFCDEDNSRLTSLFIANAETPNQLVRLAGNHCFISTITFSPDSSLIAGLTNTQIIVWDIAPGGIVSESPVVFGIRNVIDWSPIGNQIATDLPSPIEIMQYPTWSSLSTSFPEDFFPTLSAISWDSNGQRIAFGTYDGLAGIYEPSEGTITAISESVENRVSDILWTSDSSKVIVGRANGEIVIWDAEQEITDSTLGSSGVNDLALDENDLLLVSAEQDEVLRVWNINSGKLLDTITTTNPPTRVVWNPDQQSLTYASDLDELGMPLARVDLSP